MKLVFIAFFLFVGSICYPQKEDYNWILGSSGLADWSGFNYFNFNHDSLIISKRNDKKLGFSWANSVLSDKDGKLQLISNAMDLYDENLSVIENGKKINYNLFWQNNEIELDNGVKKSTGLQLSQGMLMLPWPDRDSVIWLTPNWVIVNGNITGDYIKGLFYGIIDNSKANPKVILKDSLIIQDSISKGGIQACRHSNGRDWWIVVGNHNKSKLYTYLFDPSGIKKVNTFQSNLNYIFGLGQGCFSPLGDKFAMFEVIGAFGLLDQGHLSILDFDRCTGEFSNLRYMPFVGEEFLVGCSISQSGQFLYTGNSTTLTQYDLFANDILKSEKIVAKSDGFVSVYNEATKKENLFLFMQLAPDGKIYGPGGNTLHMHRMEYPDEAGEACTMHQHAINTVSNSCSIPNFPYFRLGPEDGSICDTLGLDNNPIAKFRYEADTTNHLKVRFTDISYFRPETWSWDFGDGTTFDGKKPYWHTFPKNGTYNVCLTVSNENSSNTSCRMVTIGGVNSEELTVNREIVSVFPNPTDGPLLVTLSEYIPEQANIILFDLTGREVYKQRVYYDWNNVDISGLSIGTYLYKVMDGKRKIGEGKVVKVE